MHRYGPGQIGNGEFDEFGEILAKKSIKTLSMNGVEDTMKRIWETVKELLNSLNMNEDDLEGVGMGIPGAVIDSKIVGFYANFAWEKNQNISEIFERSFHA